MTLRKLAAASAIALTAGGAVQAQELFEMTTAFGRNTPLLGSQAVNFVEKINSISTEVEFEQFDPNELVPAFEALEAVSNGSVDAAYTTAGYWAGKLPVSPLFSAVPFGPEAGEFLAWLYYDDGMEFYQRMYDEGGFNVKVLPCSIMPPETSGWFKNEINGPEDLEGLNMRFFGLGGEVMQRLGVSTSLLPGGEIFPALERGAIDATEFAMPAVDAALGFYNIAKFNYFPGWHQPATVYELLINGDRWNDLDEITQNQIEMACMANVAHSYAEGEAINFPAMVDNVENNGVTILQWSDEMLELFESTWNEVAAEFAAEDEFFAEVWADLQEFRAGYATWGNSIYLPRPRN